MAQQKAFQRSIVLPAGLGDWTQLKPAKPEEAAIQVGPIKGVYFDRLPQAAMRQALDVHYHFAQDWVKTFSQQLRIKLELHTVQCQQASYGDFLREYSRRVYQVNFSVLNSVIHFYMDEILASALVNRALGGKGEAAPDATLSPAEKSILLQLVNKMLAVLAKAWQGVLPELTSTAADSYGTLQVDGTLAKEDTYVVFSMDIVVGSEAVRSFRWGYSRGMLNHLLAEFSAKKTQKTPQVILSEKVRSTLKVPMRMVLGSAHLTANELKKIQVGDVVALDASLSDPVQVCISDCVVLYGQPGLVDKKLGVQLLSPHALAMVYRGQMSVGASAEPLVVDDEALLAQAQASEQTALRDELDLADEADEAAMAEAIPAEEDPPALRSKNETAVSVPVSASSNPDEMSSADESEELDDLFADDELNWDEDVDDDGEN